LVKLETCELKDVTRPHLQVHTSKADNDGKFPAVFILNSERRRIRTLGCDVRGTTYGIPIIYRVLPYGVAARLLTPGIALHAAI
jgi:hypothetical protein